MEFSRLEARDILANLDVAGVDPDVLKKLEACAGRATAPSPFTISRADADRAFAETFGADAAQEFSDMAELMAARKAREEPKHDGDIAPPPALLILDERLQALGYQQADVDKVNNTRQMEYQAYLKMRERRPVVGEENAGNINADFAQPDNAQGLGVEEGVKVGSLNRAGDKCIIEAKPGVPPVFECKQGHPYNQTPALPGCPKCFMEGAGGGASSNSPPRDSDSIPGEEDF